MEKQLRDQEKVTEQQKLQKNLQLKADIDNMEKQQLHQMKHEINDQFQKVLDYNQGQRSAFQHEERNIDKYMVDKDRNDYMNYQAAMKDRKRWNQEHFS